MTHRIHFVSFSTPSFRPRQWFLERSALQAGKADAIHTWNPARLGRDGFLSRHADLFPGSKGFGWYAWKPHIIHHTLALAKEGDLIVYQDVGRRKPITITSPLGFWKIYLEKTGQPCIPGVEIPWWGPNRCWTKKYAFEALGMDQPDGREKPQIQASWSVWKKCPASVSFTQEWAALSTRRDLIGGELPDGLAGECPSFKEHRWDQSLLTLLSRRNHLQPLVGLTQPEIGFDEKSCSAWMERLGALPSPTSSGFQAMVDAYIFLESTAKILFKRREFLPESETQQNPG
jgi:hypothetical protein